MDHLSSVQEIKLSFSQNSKILQVAAEVYPTLKKDKSPVLIPHFNKLNLSHNPFLQPLMVIPKYFLWEAKGRHNQDYRHNRDYRPN